MNFDQNPKRGDVSPSETRILIFTHDGRGLGHLRRLSLIAKRLQRQHSVLILTGHRAASWVVPPECEFIKLPSLDSIDPRRARRWRRAPFSKAGLDEGLDLRRSLIRATLEKYRPDALILDYLPMGHHEEMHEFVSGYDNIRKYFVVRGILDDPARVCSTVLPPAAMRLLEERYDRIFVACDQRIIDIGKEYDLPEKISSKLEYVGYVAETIPPRAVEEARKQRGIPSGAQWVVCSAGGGNNGYEMMNTLYNLSPRFPDTYFDFVLGPRSTVQFVGSQWLLSGRVRVVNEDPHLAYMHAACDVMVSFGGYNSLVEGLSGKAQMIVSPFPGDYEQEQNVIRLRQFRPMVFLKSLSDLEPTLRDALMRSVHISSTMALRMNGAATIAHRITDDLKGRRGEKSLAEQN